MPCIESSYSPLTVCHTYVSTLNPSLYTSQKTYHLSLLSTSLSITILSISHHVLFSSSHFLSLTITIIFSSILVHDVIKSLRDRLCLLVVIFGHLMRQFIDCLREFSSFLTLVTSLYGLFIISMIMISSLLTLVMIIIAAILAFMLKLMMIMVFMLQKIVVVFLVILSYPLIDFVIC